MTKGSRAATLLDLVTGSDAAVTALESVERAPLSYGALAAQVGAAADWLGSAGVTRTDATAIVLPNGPELATAFLGTAVAGISAPLNPAYRREEFAFYLDDLRARVLLIAEGLDSPARDVARERGIRIVEVGLPPGAPAGVFSLDGAVPSGAGPAAPVPGNTALILHTSGTTSRPKMVPLTHANLVASAAAVARTLRLSPDDRCLNVMPLFHIHGLVAAVLGSLTGGGSVVCTPGFLAPRFFAWLAQCDPTWYTAVPTMHQGILSRAGEPAGQAVLRASRLRFARSSSAAMPRRLLEELEASLGVPVIEAYGMTEAAHQMASNPLPPAARKAGSVGPAAGPEIGIMDPAGRLLPAGATGEVVIRGPNVTAGYQNNPDANARAFADGWLRTGDEGILDEDGYLSLTGRLKEQINRAGEKISPLEVDQVLTDHPAVAQALCFGVAHPVLGEDIGAAVVVRPGAVVSERELREYVAGRLVYYKVPRRIVLVDSIPTGPTGKLQRLGLAERLHVTANVPVDDTDLTPPRTPVEEIVAAAWEEVMGRAPPGVRRNFFALGGDSILATRLVARLREQLAVEVTLLALFDASSVEGIARAVETLLGEEPAPPLDTEPPAKPGTPPATPTEAVVASIWEDVLGVPRISREDRFFDLGGHSLLAMRVASRLAERYGIEVSSRTMLEHSALVPLATEVDRLLRARQSGAAVAEPAGAPSVGAPDLTAPYSIHRRIDRARAPATPEQRLLWEIERVSPGTSAYNLAIHRRIEGPLNLDALSAALDDVASRHEAFRTSFGDGADGLLLRISDSVHVPVEMLDFRDRPPAEADQTARAALRERAARPFDLTRAPLCRVTLARVANEDTLLLLVMHHLVCDGWSVGLIQSELSLAYQARAEGGAPLPPNEGPDFGDYTAWLARPERRARRRDHLEYWRTLLEGANLGVELPIDHARPSGPTFEGHTERILLSAELLGRLELRARAQNATLNVLLLACFRILLYRLGGQEDLTYGTVLAGRDTVDVERMIGYFARTVLLRTRVDESTSLADLIRDTRGGIIDALDHPASLEEVVNALARPGDWAFRLLFSFNEDPKAARSLGPARMRTISNGLPGAKVDLSLAVSRMPDGLEAVLNTRSALYEPETTRRFLHLFETLLHEVARGVEGPVSRISLFREGEREETLRLAAGPALATRTDRTIAELFLEQAARTPEQPALIAGDDVWTYATLAERADRLAGSISERGIGPGDVVAIVSGRTPEMMMAIVAVVLAGAAYLPMDPEQPAARIAAMLDEAGVKLVLADAAGAAASEHPAPVQRLDAPLPTAPQPATRLRTPAPSDPVYVIFTSGSTGRPKGVAVPHRALVNHMDWLLDAFRMGSSDVVLQRTPLGFDASVWEVWGPLLAGCPMVLADRDGDVDPRYLGDAIRAHGVTTIQLVPSMLSLLLELEGFSGCHTLRRVFCGGEPLSTDLARRFHAAHAAELVNLYGPTEVTIDATWWRSRPGFAGSTIPIGRPIANLSAYVLDAHREPRPIGLPGELYLGGIGVALGYVNRPDLTSERFIPDPFGPAGGRMYRTGDRARFLADGTIEYLGRMDDQIKLRGVRIEPGEIEALLNARPDVLESAVGVDPNGPGGARLVAWMVLQPGTAPTPGAVRDDLARALPRALVPSAIVYLERLPRTPSGKIDRRALRAPREDAAPYEPPRTATEARVAEAWAAVLGRERIGRDDDLFALGGHSLTAIRIAHRLRTEGVADVSLAAVLEFPTVASLAAELDRRGTAATPAGAIPKLARVPRLPRPGTPLPPVSR